MTNPLEDPNEFPLFAPLDADDMAEALAEAIIADDDNWIRVFGIEDSSD
ncbi:hypothetical protein OG225_15910 [Nocardia sp. NBC_01377]